MAGVEENVAGVEESVAGVEGSEVVWEGSEVGVEGNEAVLEAIGAVLEENEAALEGIGVLLEAIEVLLEESAAFPCPLGGHEAGFLSFQPLVGDAETPLEEIQVWTYDEANEAARAVRVIALAYETVVGSVCTAETLATFEVLKVEIL